MRSITYTSLYAAAILMMILAGSQTTMAVTCQVTQLAPCASAISSSSPPSSQCCAKIKEQKPCLCQYMKNPSLKAYVSSPNAKKVANACGVPIPKC
uniref:Putative nonspecific lipid transfer protein n=1 Tax=Zinnia elegans TaxID=34245 RepID=Q42392_ZINEL|nr:putative nonspecific lipid transfer; auxin induced gene [Zinnia elegans]BAA06462.1 TED4 [Zinnia elegans]